MKLGIPLSYPGSILVIFTCGYFGVVSSFSFLNLHFDQDGNSPNPSQVTESIPLDYSSSSLYASAPSTSSRPWSRPTEWDISYAERTEDSVSHMPTVCRRVQRNIFVGRDTTGREYHMDVGQCTHVRVPPTQFLKKRSLIDICDEMSPCDVTQLRKERNHLLGGEKHYDVIESCGCRKVRQQCTRVPLLQTFFPNSPFEVQVDVGACRGACFKENCDGCFPIEKMTKSIEGPNGDECVEKVEECACTSSCYRASHYQIYNIRRWDEASNTTRVEQRKFDVGICLGTCSPRPLCLIWDPTSGKCLTTLSTPSSCSATFFTTHVITTEDGNEKMVISIGNCICT